MVIEVWVVQMPEGDRPYTRSSPPLSSLVAKWKAEGGRIFRITATVPDNRVISETEAFGAWPKPSANVVEL